MNLKERLPIEIKLLTTKYGEVESFEESGLILIKNYKLPKGWNRVSTDILLNIPAGYPTALPYAFRVPSGFRLESNQLPSNYREGHSALGKTWGQFSISVEEWKPSDDVVSGHNFLTFMVGVEERLGEIN